MCCSACWALTLVNGRNSGPFAGVARPAPTTATRRLLPRMRHTLGGRFLAYWQRVRRPGDLRLPAQRGVQRGQSATDGKTYTVQYFERARFEYHPENAGPLYEVLLGFLGRDYSGKK